MGLFNRKKKIKREEELDYLVWEMGKADSQGFSLAKFEINEKLRQYIKDYSYFFNRGMIIAQGGDTHPSHYGGEGGDYIEPIQCFLKSIELNPSFLKARFLLAGQYMDTDQNEKAIDECLKVLELESEQKIDDFTTVCEFYILISMIMILQKQNVDAKNWINDVKYGSKIKEKIEKLREIFNKTLDQSVCNTDDKILLWLGKEDHWPILKSVLPNRKPDFNVSLDLKPEFDYHSMTGNDWRKDYNDSANRPYGAY